jgi:hypothetical protein
LVELEHNREQFAKLGIGLVAISYDSVAILHNFAERRGIHFPMLSDAGSKIIRSAGLLNETIPHESPFFGIPNPGTFILDAKGVVTAKYFEDDYRERFTAADILTKQFNMTPSSGRHEVIGKQLTAVASSSNYVVRAGQRVALVLDVELKPKMHVYAPGVEGYIPIAWKMKESPAFAVHDVTLPPSKMLHLPAINETVPVYQGKFRIERDITIAAEGKVKPLVDGEGQFLVEGTLQYQACDDRMCYVPQELKVGWTFQLEGLDRERVPAELQKKNP